MPKEAEIRRCPRCYRPAVTFAITQTSGEHWCPRHGAVMSIPGVIRRKGAKSAARA